MNKQARQKKTKEKE